MKYHAMPIIIGALLCLSLIDAQTAAHENRRSGGDTARDKERDARVLNESIALLRQQNTAQSEDEILLAETAGHERASAASHEGENKQSAAITPEEAETRASSYRQTPLRTGATRAPRPGRRPSPNPLEFMSRRTIRDAIMHPVEFGEPGLGFSPPDWTEPLRDIEADTMVTDMNTGETVLTDNVRLRLGEMLFSSDEFRYSEEAGSYRATGNVLVRQHYSELSAGLLEYFAPEPEVVEKTFILEPAPTEQDFARRRLTMGRLRAEQLNVVGPTRRLYADYVDYDFAQQTGELRNARGLAAVFYYDAERVRILGPDDAIIENASFTTCSKEDPHYRIRVKELTIKGGKVVSAQKARLQLGRYKPPFYLPFWKGGSNQPWMLDFDSGRRAEIGYFTNVGVQFDVTPEVSVGPRFMPTTKQGIGVGGDLFYDFYNKPSSYLYRTKGDAHILYTTKDRGYGLWRHRYDLDNDLAVRVETEQWSDREFFKDFFYDEYRNRTTPRTFANVTYRQPDYIATGTVRVNTHSWIREAERLPEGTFHLIERPLFHNFYGAYDNVTGYNRRKQYDLQAARTVHIARLSYDWDPHPALGVTPFYEAEGSWYQRLATRNDSASRFSNTIGATLQTRFHKIYPGMLGFSGFKHVVVPSVTYSYRPSSTMNPYDAPQYDALDNVYGRSRIESKISNVFYGREAESNEVWQVGRLTLYQGNDFWNEIRKSDDYEVEIDVRPRPWWGAQLVGERHISARHAAMEHPNWLARWFPGIYGRFNDEAWRDEIYALEGSSADYSRILSQVYYDDTLLGGKFSSRVGFAYTDTGGRVYNREILYGVGYKLGENWGLGFEHIYNLKDGELRSQTYELRRRFHCWESALRVRDRESGLDVNVEISLVALPGTAIKF
ncbi:MAG TPA: LPS-assembly protein LptD [Candidatus Hydrogenedentes bacterium]|nr:LPS-assembly protein LptD [Candidatus Hydrogenedentota bacterium]